MGNKLNILIQGLFFVIVTSSEDGLSRDRCFKKEMNFMYYTVTQLYFLWPYPSATIRATSSHLSCLN